MKNLNAGSLRTVFGLIFKLSLSLLLAFIIYQINLQSSNREAKRRLQHWRENSDIILEAMKSASTFTGEFHTCSAAVNSSIKKNITEKFTYTSVAPIFEKEFAQYLTSIQTKLWLFAPSKRGFKRLKGDILAKENFRIMERVINSLYSLKSSNLSSSKRTREQKNISTVFGAKSAPGFLATYRQGTLTPVKYKTRRYYVYWDIFANKDKLLGAAILLIPYELKEQLQQRLLRVANSFYYKSGKIFCAAFVPNKFAQDKPIVVPDIIKKDKALKTYLKLIKDAYSKLDSRLKEEFIEYQGYFFANKFLPIELPYNLLIFSPAIKLKKPSLKIYLSFVVLLWAIVYPFLFFKTGRLGIPIEASFKILFFLVGLFPITLMLWFGTNLIENDFALQIKQAEAKCIKNFQDLNEQSSLLIFQFRETIRQFVSKKENFDHFQSQAQEYRQATFNELRSYLQNKDMEIDAYFTYVPDGKAEAIFSTEESRNTLSESFNIYPSSIQSLHKNYHQCATQPSEIKLNPAQKRWQGILSQIGKDDYILGTLYKEIIETVNYFKIGKSNKTIFTSVSLKKDANIDSYLIFGVTSNSLYKSFINRELINLNKRKAEIYSYIYTQNASNYEIYPKENNKIWQSKIGKKMLSLLKYYKNSSDKFRIDDTNNIFIAYPLEKMEGYTAGAIIPLNEFKSQKLRNQYLLFFLCALFSGLMYLLASSISHYMIQPLRLIDSRLRQLSEGNFAVKFDDSRKDELGNLNHTLNRMVIGFRERKALGKFVSSTFEKSLSQTEQNTDQNEMKKITGTILFSDIRSFTTLSEQFPPTEIVEMLNTHLEEMVKIIHENEGQIEQFIGDAIVSVFSDSDVADSQIRAIKSSIEMMKRHGEIQKNRAIKGKFCYGIGIGIEQGDLLSLTLKTNKRSEFAVLGKARTNAEKLEGLTKTGKYTKIFVSKDVADNTRNFFPFTKVAEINCFELTSLESKE